MVLELSRLLEKGPSPINLRRLEELLRGYPRLFVSTTCWMGSDSALEFHLTVPDPPSFQKI